MVFAAFLLGTAVRVDAQPTAPATKVVIQPKEYKPTPSPLSPAILVGNTLYMSGATGGDPATGKLVSSGFEPEMRQVMSNLQTVLTAATLRACSLISRIDS